MRMDSPSKKDELRISKQLAGDERRLEIISNKEKIRIDRINDMMEKVRLREKRYSQNFKKASVPTHVVTKLLEAAQRDLFMTTD